SLKPEHLKRYKDIAWLFVKYGRSDLVKSAGLEDVLKDERLIRTPNVISAAEELAADLEKRGPTFVKLGQLLSTRADLLPPPYLEALARLQDRIEPFPFEEVERIIVNELGVRISKAFRFFDPVPIAAASLGQVHRATLTSGRPVVVKVQRPEIRECIAGDLDSLAEVAEFLDRHTELGRRYEFQNMLDGLRKSLVRELDYRQEGNHLATLAANLKEFPQIVIPLPVEDYTTSRVLTMDYIRGQKITALSQLAWLETDGAELAEEFFHAYLKQILVDGFFHADPHPGNVFLTEDGRIGLLDLGMVAHLSPGFQENLLKLLLAISEGRGEEAADVTIKLGVPKEEFDRAEFTRQVSEMVVQHQQASLERLDAGQVVLSITRIAGDCNFRLPPEFTMIAKTLLNLDRVVWALDPQFDPNASIRRHAASLLEQRFVKGLSPMNFFGSMMEAKDFVEKFPGRLNKILENVANNNLKVEVDAIDERVLVDGLQKVANRITLGLVLAALIVGAALLMRVETSFRIFGYPGLAILCFLGAAGGGVALIIDILHNDEKPRRGR
ncbi:MAG: AarF/ABC1/UbiB kinase family protein, partial [Deltaproteobacteria bacterium]|nr:AarF/ABC1/UbiB kinase family protein [Deltaproteobacteria bacterium]